MLGFLSLKVEYFFQNNPKKKYNKNNKYLKKNKKYFINPKKKC